jgi:DNA-binding transcriptional LysR family regulator
VHFAVAARRRHPAAARSLSAAAWTRYPHVMVRTGHAGTGFVATALDEARFDRRIGLVVPTFLSALMAVAETDFYFTGPRELMAPLCRRFALRLFEPPVTVPPVRVAVWHERYHRDAGHRFFRAIVIDEVARRLKGRAQP